MFRNSQTFYCKNPDVVKQAREFIKKLNETAPTYDEWVKNAQNSPQGAPKEQKGTTTPPNKETRATGQNIAKQMPSVLLDVLNGGRFPELFELTKNEQTVLYDPVIKALIPLYHKSNNPEVFAQIEERFNDLGVDF